MNRLFLFGLGTGLMVTSLIVFGLLSMQPKDNKEPVTNEIMISEEDLQQRISEARDEGRIQGRKEMEQQNQNLPESVFIYISKGITSDEVSELLTQAKLIEDETDFADLIKSRDDERKIKAGLYEISVSLTDEEIANLITN